MNSVRKEILCPSAPTSKTMASDVRKRRRFEFTQEQLYNHLFGRTVAKVVKTENLRKNSERELASQPENSDYESSKKLQKTENGQRHDPLGSLQKLVHGDNKQTVIQASHAMMSFPDEVELCTSSIPGAAYGVCGKQPIPVGTWIGPYEGRRIRPEDVSKNVDNGYMWEIFENGRLVYYLDASDEEQSSWMRYIRCARHKQEQNLYVFQYCGNIYYRAFRDIPPGCELLVWYDEKYTQHMGIPLGLNNIPFVTMEDVQSRIDDSPVPPNLPYHPPHGGYPIHLPGDMPGSNHSGYRPHGLPQNVPPGVPTFSEHQPVAYDPRIIEVLKDGHYLPYPIHSSHPQANSIMIYTQPPLKSQHSPTPAQKQEYRHDQDSYQEVYRHRVKVKTQTQTASERPQEASNIQSTRRNLDSMKKDEEVVHTRDQDFDQFRKELELKNQVRKERETPFREATANISKSDSKQRKNISHYQNTANINKAQPVSSYQHANPRSVEIETIQVKKITEARHQAEADRNRDHPGHQKDSNDSQVMPMATYHPQFSDHYSVSQQQESHAYRSHKRDYVHDTPPQSPLENKSVAGHHDENGNMLVTDEGNVIQTVNGSGEEHSLWKCGQCNKTFSQRISLQLHVCTRNPDKPYQCGHCSLSFSHPGELRNHVVTHTNDRPFRCGFCSRTFAGATTLNNHIRTHTGEKPFTCEKCGRHFSQATQLSRHQRLPGDCIC